MCFSGVTPRKTLKSSTKAVLASGIPAHLWLRMSLTLPLNIITYATAEHYMMAEKARLFKDERTRQQILAAEHPHAAKKLGRHIQPFHESVWKQQRFAIVVQGNLAKFSQYPALKDFLLQTGERILVEASPMDTIWGIGLAQDNSQANDPTKWRGDNLLGFALMVVRDQLQQAEQQAK